MSDPVYTLRLNETQTLDVLAAVETMRDISREIDQRGRLTALLDDIAAQTGAIKS